MSELAVNAPAGQLDNVIRQRAGEISSRTDVRDDLQPCTDVSNRVIPERA